MTNDFGEMPHDSKKKGDNSAMIMKLLRSGPAMFVALIGALLSLGISFGLGLTATQEKAVMGVVAVVIGLVVRSQVVPVVKVITTTDSPPTP